MEAPNSVTQWDAQGNPITSPSTPAVSQSQISEWDANGNPVTSGSAVPASPNAAQPTSGDDDQWGPKWADDASKAVLDTATGAAKGALQTVSGTDQWAREHMPAFMTNSDFGFGKPANLEHLQQMATPNGVAQHIGAGAEDLGEFIMGDEALKALPASQRLLKASKILQSVEESPVLNRIVQAGIRAIRGAAVGGAQGAAKTGDAGTAASSAIGAGVGSAVVPELFDAAKAGVKALPAAVDAIKRPFSLKAVQDVLQNSTEGIQKTLQGDLQGIQDAWHGKVRDLFQGVAKDASVQPKPAESLRDVTANTAAAVKAQASSLYKQIDKALGGTRFQTFDEQLSNVRRALRNSAGIDPDADGRMIERINDLEDAKSKALETARSNGVDPKLIEQANAKWRQASALEDLSKHIQSSTSGLRGDLAQGMNAAQESLSPAKLASRANRLYSSGRLQQALGDDRADQLLQHIETTKQAAQDTAESAAKRTEAAKASAQQQGEGVRIRRYVAGAALAGIPGFELLRHLLGE